MLGSNYISLFTKLKTNLCITFNAPQSSGDHNSELIEDINSDIMFSSFCPFLIVGDMNGRTGTQIDY